MKRLDELEFTIANQGAPVVNSASVIACDHSEPTVLAVSMDLGSKWCVVEATGSDGHAPVVDIGSNENSLHLHATQKGMTEIVFPKLRGYRIFAADLSRYTLNLCFVKGEP